MIELIIRRAAPKPEPAAGAGARRGRSERAAQALATRQSRERRHASHPFPSLESERMYTRRTGLPSVAVLLLLAVAVVMAVVIVAMVAMIPRVGQALREWHSRAASVRAGAGRRASARASFRGVDARTRKAFPSCLKRQNSHSHIVVPMKTCRFLCHCCTLGTFRPRYGCGRAGTAVSRTPNILVRRCGSRAESGERALANSGRCAEVHR